MDAELWSSSVDAKPGRPGRRPVGLLPTSQGWNRDTTPPFHIGASATTTSNMHPLHTYLAVAYAHSMYLLP